jgi:hypothetical protein
VSDLTYFISDEKSFIQLPIIEL